MESPEITYGTTQEKRVLFQEALTDFSVDPFNRLGKSRTQTNKVKTSHLGTHDIVTITEEIEDGARMDEVMELYEFLKSGGVCAVKRDSGLAFAASFNGRALKDQDRNTLGAFTRAQSASQSNAWYNDPHSGVLTNELLVDTPRFPAGQQGLTQNGLLLQRTRKNELDTNLSNWTIGSAGADFTLTPNSTEVLSPEGLNNAFKLTSNNGNATITLVVGSLGTTIDGAYSFYLKSDIGSLTANVTLVLEGAGGGSHSTATLTLVPDGPEPNGWTRFLLKHVDGTDPDLIGLWEASIFVVNSGISFYAYGPQLEVGTSVLDPSGLIVGNGLTRLDETYLITDATLADEYEGSAGFWFIPDFDLADQDQGWLFTIGNAASEVYSCLMTQGGSFIQIIATTGAGTNVTSSNMALTGILVKGEPMHVGVTWNARENPSIRGFINGNQIFAAGDVFNPRTAGNLISLGSRNNGTFRLPGVYDQFFLRKDALSAFDMFQMANNPQLFFERRNNWDTMVLNNNLAPDENIGNGRYRFTLQLEETL